MYRRLERANSLLLEYIAGEEEEGCKHADCLNVSRGFFPSLGIRADSGRYCDRYLTAGQKHDKLFRDMLSANSR